MTSTWNWPQRSHRGRRDEARPRWKIEEGGWRAIYQLTKGAWPQPRCGWGLCAMQTQGSSVGMGKPRNPYMFFSMSDFSSPLCSLGDLPTGGLWNESERSELSGATRPSAGDASARCLGGWRRILFRSCVPLSLLFSLLRQGIKAVAPAQGATAVCASSFNPRTVCSQSVAQREPRTPSAPNSNRCLSRGLGREFACIRLSQITLPRH